MTIICNLLTSNCAFNAGGSRLAAVRTNYQTGCLCVYKLVATAEVPLKMWALLSFTFIKLLLYLQSLCLYQVGLCRWPALLEDLHLTVCFQEVTYHGGRAQLVHHPSLQPEKDKTLLYKKNKKPQNKRDSGILIILEPTDLEPLSRKHKEGSVMCEISTECTSTVHS